MSASSTWVTLGVLCENMNDLRQRFMRVTDDQQNAENLWARMESSMDEDEIEEYLERLESNGQKISPGEKWESDLEILWDVWDADPVAPFSPDQRTDVSTESRSLTVTGDILSVLRRGLGNIYHTIGVESAHADNEAEGRDAVCAILKGWAEELATKLKSTSSSTRKLSLNPIEIYLLLLSSGRAMEPYTGTLDDVRRKAESVLRAIILRLTTGHIDRTEESIRTLRDLLRKLRGS